MIQQQILFPQRDLTIVQITNSDAKRKTDELQALRKLVLSNEEMYPAIREWFDQKVTHGLISGERSAFLGMSDGRPVASAIVKRGEKSKFCHLQVVNHLQEQHLGELFFVLMTLQIRQVACEVHFTLPEGLWEHRRGFFQSFGFDEARKSATQYRTVEQELVCSARFDELWSAALQKLPKLVSSFSSGGHALDNSIVLSLRPQWAAAIIQGRKRVEIRRVFSARWEGHRASLYATNPIKSLVGEARIGRVVEGTPAEIWAIYGADIGCDRASFDSYTGSASRVFALELTDVRPFARQVGVDELAAMLGEKPRAPQSYSSHSNTSVWGRCVSLAALLNNHEIR
ncbi:MAG: hypothetical protein IPK82_27895 [Polyangiaceae bacterium]|nr:hypothetical protein [Polyangiaceae bacterium]